MAKEEKCKCRPAMGVLGIILLTVGLYTLVLGFILQTTAGAYINWQALLSYLVAVVLLGFGMMSRHKGYCECKLHSM
ncbi:MAG: hypothetical protein WCP39_08075 [Chlamydiota bacterium]